jgi:hypothetical protein
MEVAESPRKQIIKNKNPYLELTSLPPPIKTCRTGYTVVQLGVSDQQRRKNCTLSSHFYRTVKN